ncbi:chromosomal replication initiator protein DnaA [Nannocystis sp.]|uniref:chromosomal replication initiator protein DnaA n=1 Tax=Nannocystis sp. TaxID=1962667 RepID=UPI002425EB16|nr:chromosomal replication initiator protein DnaA [Nannocystis sp.]MBK7824689.1 chromosomal replication initiator protein DnaA [Nannocystis sp.]MBK9753061.1 chromosomal replication initiator protein DnaA [Nannocystis sp.]
MSDIWSEALQGLQPRLGAQTYDLWLRPIALRRVTGTHLHLTAPNRFMKEWFENHYLGVVLDELRARTAQTYDVEIEVTTEPTPAPLPNATTPPPPRPLITAPPPQLSGRYRFQNFIKGAGNELAASAAWAAANEPGTRFNPFFIYGGVGLGKTHLLHAIGHHIHATRPELRIVYQSAERFMNEFIAAVRFNQFDEFRSRYREQCDVLLIDDIQFIAGRDRTMDEFFHVFNVLYEAEKQIVVTADRMPSEMQGMEDRLISRLNWGLVADIKPPDLETRIAILRQKAEHDRIPISDDVTLHLASIVRSNVRELEGSLVRVSTLAGLKNVPITCDFVSELLGAPAVNAQPPPVSIENVQKTVAAHFSVRITDLKGPRRHQGISRPRMIAMYLSRQLTGASFPEIGLRFGGKDHSTVINACKRIESIQSDDRELRATVDTLRRQLTSDTSTVATM